jgi:cephalosporin hydroxylase
MPGSSSPRQFYRHAKRVLLDPLAWHLSVRQLRTYFSATSAEEIVRATSEYTGRGFYARISAMQDEREFTDMVRLIQQRQPRVILEIGTRSGGTLFAWVRASQAAEIVISVDLPEGRFGGGYDERRTRLYREFAADRPHTRMEMLRVDSHSEETLRMVKQLLGGRTIDFLFIDGDHTYAGVRRDYEMYAPLVTSGGLIGFHDIRTSGREREVPQLWHELKAAEDWEEIAYKPDHLGIGLIRKARA